MPRIALRKIVFVSSILTLCCLFVTIALIFSYGINDLINNICVPAENVFEPDNENICKEAISNSECIDKCKCGWCESVIDSCLQSDQKKICDGKWIFEKTPICMKQYNVKIDECNYMKLIINIFWILTVVLIFITCVMRSFVKEEQRPDLIYNDNIDIETV